MTPPVDAFELAGEGGGTTLATAQERRETRRQYTLAALRVLVGVGLLAAWQLASGRLVDPFFVSSPLAVAAKLALWVERGTLATHLSVTLYAMVVGFVIGAAAGFMLGFAFGRWEGLASVFDPYVTAVYCLPKIALAPLFIMWFGIGISSKIAMSATVVFFLVFLNTYAGVRDVNPIHLHATRIMGAGELALVREVIVPSAAAWVMTGLKVAVPYALIGTVVGEFMSSNRGIGFLIAQASGIFDTAAVFAGLVVLALVGALINGGLKRIERHVLRWRAPSG